MKYQWVKQTSLQAKGQPANIGTWIITNNSLITISITNNHKWHEKKWVVNCRGLGIDEFVLKIDPNATLEEAQNSALKVVGAKLFKLNMEYFEMTMQAVKEIKQD